MIEADLCRVQKDKQKVLGDLDKMRNDMKRIEAKEDELRKLKEESKAEAEDLKKKLKLKISQWEHEMHAKDQMFHEESQMYLGEVCSQRNFS